MLERIFLIELATNGCSLLPSIDVPCAYRPFFPGVRANGEAGLFGKRPEFKLNF
jgi:hypothetical protein